MAIEAKRQSPLQKAMAACRRVWLGVALFSACANLLMLSVPMYMMQVYDRVLPTSNVDTLLALSAMVVIGLASLRPASTPCATGCWCASARGSTASWGAPSWLARWPTPGVPAAACRRRGCATWRRCADTWAAPA